LIHFYKRARMGLQIPLPHSKKGPYKGNMWPIFEKDMHRLQAEPTLAKLEEIILKHVNRNIPSPLQELPNLRNIFNQKQMNGQHKLISFLASLALKLPILFPGGHLECLQRQNKKTEQSQGDTPITNDKQSIRFTRHQVACLLSHMLLCTILSWKEMARSYCGHFTGAIAPTGPLTFITWLYRDEYGPTDIPQHPVDLL